MLVGFINIVGEDEDFVVVDDDDDDDDDPSPLTVVEDDDEDVDADDASRPPCSPFSVVDGVCFFFQVEYKSSILAVVAITK